VKSSAQISEAWFVRKLLHDVFLGGTVTMYRRMVLAA